MEVKSSAARFNNRSKHKINDTTGLIDASEYQHLAGMTFPDDIELEITDPVTQETKTILSGELQFPLTLNIQPGPSYAGSKDKPAPPEWALPQNWASIPGGPACTKEAIGICENLPKITKKCNVYGLSNKPSKQQQMAIKEKGITYPLISDGKLSLATKLRLPVATVKRTTEETPSSLTQTTETDYSYIERVTLYINQAKQIERIFCGITDPEKFAKETLFNFISSLPDLPQEEKQSATTKPIRKEDCIVVDVSAATLKDPNSKAAFHSAILAISAGAGISSPANSTLSNAHASATITTSSPSITHRG